MKQTLEWRIILMQIQLPWCVTRKWNEKANFKAIRDRFLNHFADRNQFLFHELKLFYHDIQYEKIPPSVFENYVKSWKLNFFDQTLYNFDLP